MNLKLLLKTIAIIALLGVLVVLGVLNTAPITLKMPSSIPAIGQQPAAFIYFGFFGIGFLVGTILMAGGGGKKSAPKPAK